MVHLKTQKTLKIKTKGLSEEYKNSLEYLVNDFLPDISILNIRKIIKNIEKEG